MNDIINKITNLDRNSQILLIIIGVISVLLVIIFLYNFINSRKERKMASLRRKNKRELKREAKKEIDFEPKKEVVPIVKKEEVVEEYELPSVSDNYEEPVETLEVLNEEVSDVDRIMNDIKNASTNNLLDLTEFEKEQEESAIISYEELCKKAGVEQKIYKKEEPVVHKENTNSNSMFKNGYRRTQMISPIFGIQSDKEEILQ